MQNIGFKYIIGLVSEGKYLITLIIGMIVVVFVIPLFCITVLFSSGFKIVSAGLAIYNATTKTVELINPFDGTKKVVESSTVWPVNGEVTTEFGVPHLPWQEHHTGIDISTGLNAPVTSFKDGTVQKINNNYVENQGYGKYIIIDHGDNLTSLYGHLNEINVELNQQVKAGEVIGLEGSTGASTGPHIHFEIRYFGIPIDPRIFFSMEPNQQEIINQEVSN